MRCAPCNRYVRLLAERRAYYEGAREDIADLNLFACLVVSAGSLVLSIACVTVHGVLCPHALTVFGGMLVAAFVPPSILAIGISAALLRRRVRRRAAQLSMAVMVLAYALAIGIDVGMDPERPGVFMPMACLAIPSLFILPAKRRIPITAFAALAWTLLTWFMKDAALFLESVLHLVSALSCSALIADLSLRSRMRHYNTGMRHHESSLHDALSQLLNRQGAFEEIQRRIDAHEAGASCALAVVDIDEFKSINDDLGHLMGDMAIRRVAQILEGAAGDNDVVGRFGGDEFVLYLDPVDEGRVRRVFERVARACATAIEAETGRTIACSVGVVISQGQPMDLVAAFSQADRALYVAKKSGRDRIVVIPYIPADASSVDAQTDAFLQLLLGPETGMLSFSGGAEDERAVASQPAPTRPTERAPRPSDDGAAMSDGAYGAVEGELAETMLIVDDDEINRAILSNLFQDRYAIEEAGDGREAISRILANPRKYCAVLLDIMMDGMDGLATLECLKRAGLTTLVPVFMVTADARAEITRRAYELGAIDVLTKPIVSYLARRRVQSIVELFRARARLGYVVGGQRRQLNRQTERIVQLTRGMVEALATAIEFRDGDSGDHVSRIYDVTKLMLLRTDLGDGLSAEEIDSIALAAIMHDVGKIGIPDAILSKPGKLTPEEFEIMKTHTVKGEQMLSRIEALRSSRIYKYALDIARHHHERWDGSGYPDGLAGDEISTWAQVVSLADVYDALTNERRYKKAFSHERAVEMILGGECGAFNPSMLERFVAVAPDIERLAAAKRAEEAL